MLDPLSAISLASAIVQLVDFGNKLVVEGYGVYKSDQGMLSEDLEVESASTRLKELAERLTLPTKVSKTGDETALHEIAAECQVLTTELLALLEQLKVTEPGPLRTWEVVRKTIKRHQKADKIASLRRRVDKVQRDIHTHLLAIIRNDQSNTMKSLRDLESEIRVAHSTEINRIDMRSEELQSALQYQAQAIKKLSRSTQRHNSMHYAAMQQYEKSMERLLASLISLYQDCATVTASRKILDSLTFERMDDRLTQIHKEYPTTFAWIFDECQTPFKAWLREGNGTFWISGKAGSGKSTLMKFLANHQTTADLLHSWASHKGKQLLKASFFFWNAGSDMQKSQSGLLQTIVYQVFCQCPHVMELATSRERLGADDSLDRRQKPWELDELVETIHRIGAHGASLSRSFCFFIDGLDEYTGDHYQLIETLNTFAESEWIKLCVSSRPWTVFNTAYGGSPQSKLVVQDFTKPDMDKYITSEMEEDKRFKALVLKDPRAWELASEIRDRAEGVFLWVYLVVRRLWRLMSEETHNLKTLQAALRALPSDLNLYFRLMIDTIDEAHRAHTAGMFRLAVYAVPLPLIAFYYLPVVLARPNEVLRAPIEHDEDEEDDITRTTRTINAWCKDLLEVHRVGRPSPDIRELDYRIDFLHRTVRDFLVTNNDVQNIFSTHLRPDFDPGLTLMRLLLAQVKSLAVKSGSDEDLATFTSIACDFMNFARQQEANRKKLDPLLMAEMNRVGDHFRNFPSATVEKSPMHPKATSMVATHWTNACPLPPPAYQKNISLGDRSFLAFAIAYDLEQYVRSELGRDPRSLDGIQGAVLLNHALQPLVRQESHLPSYDMVLLLLEGGARSDVVAGPPESVNGTPWELFLCRCYFAPNPGLWPFARLLLEFGADPHALMEGARENTIYMYQRKEQPAIVPAYLSAETCVCKCVSDKQLLLEIRAAFADAKVRKFARKVEVSKPETSTWLPVRSWITDQRRKLGILTWREYMGLKLGL